MPLWVPPEDDEEGAEEADDAEDAEEELFPELPADELPPVPFEEVERETLFWRD